MTPTNAYPSKQPRESIALREGSWQAEQRDRFSKTAIIAKFAVPTELELIIAEQPIVPAANPMRYGS
jgi:hypothetical protein